MGTIVVFENISLDGVTQDPTGEEGFSRADWRAGLTPADRAEWDKLILADALGARALLLGRGSYEYFAARYPSREGALADQMNGLAKYVVSATLTAPSWHNTTVLGPHLVAEVSALKRAVHGEIRVYASSPLVHALMAHRLVDELRLAVFPLVLGAGTRLFDQAGTPQPLRLVESRTVGEGLCYLAYRCGPDATVVAHA